MACIEKQLSGEHYNFLSYFENKAKYGMGSPAYIGYALDLDFYDWKISFRSFSNRLNAIILSRNSSIKVCLNFSYDYKSGSAFLGKNPSAYDIVCSKFIDEYKQENTGEYSISSTASPPSLFRQVDGDIYSFSRCFEKKLLLIKSDIKEFDFSQGTPCFLNLENRYCMLAVQAEKNCFSL